MSTLKQNVLKTVDAAFHEEIILVCRIVMNDEDFLRFQEELGMPVNGKPVWVKSTLLAGAKAIPSGNFHIEQLETLTYEQYCDIHRENVFPLGT